MSRLQNVIKGMVELYEEYSDADGKISKEEMMKMVDKEVECSEMKEKLKAKKCDKNHAMERSTSEISLGVWEPWPFAATKRKLARAKPGETAPKNANVIMLHSLHENVMALQYWLIKK
ncbi:hypothetical protein PBY51_017674 [Eleginops maclovinus]|uniref:EF-hand domain-containing protein n=1 Tax=Eleginops maclovinus TaxID=56733 RepID=A0AAN7XJG3_ELEMC|nr:hypothetical protein PBY51_017674 [Eleginops maclovinus]